MSIADHTRADRTGAGHGNAAEAPPALPVLDAPLLLQAGPARKPWTGKRLLLAMGQLLLITSLVILLAGQILLHRQYDLVSNPHWRPVYQQLCQYLSCTLAPRTDITALHSESLQIHPHPLYSNRLQLQVQLSNRAEYPQPFPALELTFSNIHEQNIAAAHWQPEDYLPAAAYEADSLIPARASLPLSLSLEVPGEDPVNYRLELLAARHTQQAPLRWPAHLAWLSRWPSAPKGDH